MSKTASIFATKNTKSFEFVIADSFSIAFPPIVKADITADTAIDSSFCEPDGSTAVIFSTMATEHAPDIIPKVSPTTSLHTFDTFSLFSMRRRAVFAPYSFFDTFSSKSDVAQDVAATPIPSNVMLANIKNVSKSSVTVRLFASAVISLRKPMTADKAKEITEILIAQILISPLLYRFFIAI